MEAYGYGSYREADDVAAEVSRWAGDNSGLQASQDLFSRYSIGLPILLRIFSYLDIRTLGQAVQVCRSWYSHNKDRLTVGYDVEKNLDVCDYLSFVIQGQIKEIKLKDQAYLLAKKNKQKNASLFTADPLVEYSPTDNTIDYVNATVDLLRQYLKNQAVRQEQKKRMGLLREREEQDRRAFLNQLLHIMNNHLRDTIQALADIISGRTKWNANFEIFELSLRRYYEQLKVLFPANPSSSASASPSRKRASPTAIITDPQVRFIEFMLAKKRINNIEVDQARLVWQMRVGSDSYYCDFERFYETVIEREFLQVTSAKMKQDLYYYFNYFLNFPRDNMVTTYKWEVLTRLFGPYHEFIENFSNYVLGAGFLGLINRHHAEEILENHPQCVLMRFSRTYPTCLAFSFRKKDGKYDHYTNNPVWHGHPPFKGTRPKEETKNNIPIKEFLEKLFLNKGYKLLPHRIDGKSVAAKGTASKYAQVADPYLDTDNFENENSATHPSEEEFLNPAWGTYKNASASPSSSFSERSGFEGGNYLADEDASPVLPRASPSSSPADRHFPQQRPQLPDNYVSDSISSLVPPVSTLTPGSPFSSPMRSPPSPFSQSPGSSSSADTSTYSDVFEYQRTGLLSPREKHGGNKNDRLGSQPVTPIKAVSPKAARRGGEPQPDSSCFYLDDRSVKEELARENNPASLAIQRKSKRAESFQANYLDDVVFVDEPKKTSTTTTSYIPEYIPQQSTPITITVTPQRQNSHIDEEGEKTTAAAAFSSVSEGSTATTDNLILEALLGGGSSPAGDAPQIQTRAEDKEEDDALERKGRARKQREQAIQEFEMNASMYERDGDIHFVDEDEVFRAGNNYTTSVSSSSPSWSSFSAVMTSSGRSAQTDKPTPSDDDSILAAILDQGMSDLANTRRAEAKEKTIETEQLRIEKQRKEERRREKEERQKRKEERRRKKEESRRHAQDEFAQAASDYGADVSAFGGAGAGTGYVVSDMIESFGAELPAAPRVNEYFLDAHQPDAKAEKEREGTKWAEEEDEELMSAILESVQRPREKSKPAEALPQLPSSAYDVAFDAPLSADEEYEESRQVPNASGYKRDAAQPHEASSSVEENALKERKEEEERVLAQERQIAEARQREGFVLPYSELSAKDKATLPRYVDRSKLESYLSDQEFSMVFGCPRAVFYTYKMWRQQQLKRNANLF